MFIDREEHLKQLVINDIVSMPKPLSLTLLAILKNKGIAPKSQIVNDILVRLSLHHPVIRVRRDSLGAIWVHSD